MARSLPGNRGAVPPTSDRWPSSLWLVRHGESAGNVARDAAEAAGLPMIDVATRVMDVPLCVRGESQARTLGAWIGGLPEGERPTHTMASPYVRAQETAHLVLEASGCPPDEIDVEIDERLREREFGILDRLTRAGIEERFPEQAAARAVLGKFYHRPPGGESWADVALRLRSLLDSVGRQYAGDRLLVVSHQVVISVMRYLLERLTEAELLAIDRSRELANCSLAVFDFDPTIGRHGGMRLVRWNDVTPLERAGEAVTAEPDTHVAPR
ncbi:MAG: phosphoglycerate mutase [Actinomycetia bacterium]|nr:phosphoglycerate mutase [Actinomycetes bacterium]